MCNILLDYPDAVIRSALLASKYTLQNKETNQKQLIYVHTKEKFNDYNYDSGGIVADHPELIKAKIDPERENSMGIISCKTIFKTWNSTVKVYS